MGFHANTPITKRHFSASNDDDWILKKDVYSSWALILCAGSVCGKLPWCSPVWDLYKKKLDFLYTTSENEIFCPEIEASAAFYPLEPWTTI